MVGYRSVAAGLALIASTAAAQAPSVCERQFGHPNPRAAADSLRVYAVRAARLGIVDSLPNGHYEFLWTNASVPGTFSIGVFKDAIVVRHAFGPLVSTMIDVDGEGKPAVLFDTIRPYTPRLDSLLRVAAHTGKDAPPVDSLDTFHERRETWYGSAVRIDRESGKQFALDSAATRESVVCYAGWLDRFGRDLKKAVDAKTRRA